MWNKKPSSILKLNLAFYLIKFNILTARNNLKVVYCFVKIIYIDILDERLHKKNRIEIIDGIRSKYMLEIQKRWISYAKKKYR